MSKEVTCNGFIQFLLDNWEQQQASIRHSTYLMSTAGFTKWNIIHVGTENNESAESQKKAQRFAKPTLQRPDVIISPLAYIMC